MRLIIIIFLTNCSLNAQQKFSLQEAIDYGLKNHSEIKMANLDVQDAEAQITEFRSIGIPQVTGSINYQYYIAAPVNPIEDFITPFCVAL